MIYCSRHALERYKRRAARAFPKEYLELLFGRAEKGDLHLIKFIAVPQIACREWVRPRGNDEDYEHLLATLEAKTGLDFLGSIHSHTMEGIWEMPSYTDHHEAAAWEERVLIIDQITRRKSRCRHGISFWEPLQPLDVISYF